MHERHDPPAATLAAPVFTLNGELHHWRRGLTLADVVAALPPQEPPARLATALNGRFVAHALRGATPVAAGDRIVVFRAIVGG